MRKERPSCHCVVPWWRIGGWRERNTGASAAEEQSRLFSQSLFRAERLEDLSQELLRITGMLFETDDEKELKEYFTIDESENGYFIEDNTDDYYECLRIEKKKVL